MLALLEVDDLFAGYGSIRVLNGVSLQVQPGSITALLGSNGAGKTTLMRTIAGLIQADRGRILHEGKPIHRLPPPQRVEMGIVLVPEGRQVFSDFTVEENGKKQKVSVFKTPQEAQAATEAPVLGPGIYSNKRNFALLAGRSR